MDSLKKEAKSLDPRFSNKWPLFHDADSSFEIVIHTYLCVFVCIYKDDITV